MADKGQATVPGREYDAIFVRQVVPEEMTTGCPHQVLIVMRNTGSRPWSWKDGIVLAYAGPEGREPWGDAWIYLEKGETIAPGQEKSFDWEANVMAGPGLYEFQWRMRREEQGWFGQSSPPGMMRVVEPGMEAVAGTVDLLAVAGESPRRFMGLGFEWDPGFWRPRKAGDDPERAWDAVVGRIRWMRPALVRMMLKVQWFGRDNGTRDWDSGEMRDLCRHLDVCQELGIQVILSDWGPAGWDPLPEYGAGRQGYFEALADGLEYLCRRRGYDCIHYFVFVNEPQDGDWEKWSAAVKAVREALGRRKLLPPLVMAGPDSTNWPGGINWFRRTVHDLPGAFDVWDVHRYHPAPGIKWGRLEGAIKAVWDLVPKNDGRPRLLCESGAWTEGSNTSQNPLADTHEYGLLMADTVVQALRAGSDGLLAWMLDDSSHAGFTWGMFRSREAGQGLRPWFYAWALLTRNLPAGSRLLSMETPSPLLRALAASLPGGGWTVVLVNQGASLDLRVRIPGAAKQSFGRFTYAPGGLPSGKDGLPVPAEVFMADFDSGLGLKCPAGSLTLITSNLL